MHQEISFGDMVPRFAIFSGYKRPNSSPAIRQKPTASLANRVNQPTYQLTAEHTSGSPKERVVP